MSKLNTGWKLASTMVIVCALFLTACGGSGSGGTTVNITLTEFAINSSTTTFTHGVAYHFVVTNKGSTNHEIRIMPPDTTNMSNDQIQSATLASLNSTDLPSGATKSFDYTFTKAYPAGTLEFACHLPDHYESGMHVPIVVN